MFRSDSERRSFSLPRTITVVGRREDCDLRIPLSDVSRKHCRFIADGDVLRLEDLGSSNGTYVNGKRIQEAEINAGDTVHVGPIAFVVQINGVPPDDQIRMRPSHHGTAASTKQGDDAFDAAMAADAPVEEIPEAQVVEEAPADEISLEESAPGEEDLLR